MEERLISSYDLEPLKFKLGLEVVAGPNGPTVMFNTTADMSDGQIE